MNMTTFLLDPRVLDDCVGDGVADVEIEGEVAAFIKYKGRSLPDYLFYVTDSAPHRRALIPPRLLSLPYQKRDEQFSGKNRTTLQYQRANVILMPHLLKSGFLLPAEVLSGEVIYANGDFVKGNIDTFKLYGLAIKADDKKKNQ
jgi:hypothetical protein